MLETTLKTAGSVNPLCPSQPRSGWWTVGKLNRTKTMVNEGWASPERTEVIYPCREWAEFFLGLSSGSAWNT
jgi:hypothetical protein